jgi:hypothetical protein
MLGIVAACFLLISSLASADEWDDKATRFVDQEHARLVRRSGTDAEFVIVLEHDLAPKGVVIAVMNGAPGVTFKFASPTPPSEAAYAFMARTARSFVSVDERAAEHALRDVLAAAVVDLAKEKPGPRHGLAIIGGAGVTASCIIPSDGQMSFTLLRE